MVLHLFLFFVYTSLTRTTDTEYVHSIPESNDDPVDSDSLIARRTGSDTWLVFKIDLPPPFTFLSASVGEVHQIPVFFFTKTDLHHRTGQVRLFNNMLL